MFSKTKNSIFTIITLFIGVTLLLFSIFFVYGYSSIRASLYGNLDGMALTVLNRLTQGLSDPLWEFNVRRVNVVLTAEMADARIDCIMIQTHQDTKEGKYGKMRDRDGGIYDVRDFIPKGNHYYKSMEIKKNDEWLATVHLYLSTRYIKEELVNRLVPFFAVVLCFSMIMLGLLYLLFQRNSRVIHSFAASMQRIAAGDFKERASVRSPDEIGMLAGLFNGMMETVNEKIDELQHEIDARKTAEEQVMKNNENLKLRIDERTDQLKAAQKEILEGAHKAGMAEIASTVLHNIGNVLTSVVTSSSYITSVINKSSVGKIAKANDLLKENIGQVEEFIVNNPKGKKLLQYYLTIGDQLQSEQEEIIHHSKRLYEKTNLIKDIVESQQRYVNVTSDGEEISLVKIIEDVIVIYENSLSRYKIQIEKRFQPVPMIQGNKLKVIQILLNLFKNAKEAMEEVPIDKRKIILTVFEKERSIVCEFTDTGIGIEQDQLAKLFTFGFTTKRNGHGLGLHSCVNYMSEVNGSIYVHSDGPGKGATFTLKFPMFPNR